MTFLLLALLFASISPAAAPDNVITGTVTNVWNQEPWVKTDGVLDWYISGAGFFALEGPDGKVLLTRYGRFALDKNEDFIHELSGLRLLTLDEHGALKPLSLRGRAHKPFYDGSKRDSVLGGISLNETEQLTGFYSDGTTVNLGVPHLALVQNARKLKLVDEKKHLLALTPEAEPIAYVPECTEAAGKIQSRHLMQTESGQYSKVLR